MPSQSDDNERSALLQGTLDLLILRTLLLGSRHGQGIARSIQQQSEDVFLVDHGSLYLALQRLEEKGLVFTGMSPDGLLPETIELADHPWFVGVQFHPELKSRPFEPHPLFASFVGAAVERSRLV